MKHSARTGDSIIIQPLNSGGPPSLAVSHSAQVVEQQVKGGGTVRFLRSHTPIIEFLAMGETCIIKWYGMGTVRNKDSALSLYMYM